MARRITVTPGQLTLLTSTYVVVVLNGAFWARLFAAIQPASAMDYPSRHRYGMHPGGAVAKAVCHDHLFHTVLGIFALRTRLDDQRLDIPQRCRTARANHT